MKEKQNLKPPHLFNLPTEGWRGVVFFPFHFMKEKTPPAHSRISFLIWEISIRQFKRKESDEDATITHVFGLYNPPLPSFNLYELEIDTDKFFIFVENAKTINLPSEITEDGDYVFY
jgi:hypothetical protein